MADYKLRLKMKKSMSKHASLKWEIAHWQSYRDTKAGLTGKLMQLLATFLVLESGRAYF